MFRIFKHLTKRDWLMAVVSLFFIVSQVWLDLRLPEYMAQITVLVQTPGSSLRDILVTGGFMLLYVTGSIACAFTIGYFAARIAASFSRNLRSLVYNKVGSFSMNEVDRFGTPTLITRCTNDVTQVQMLVTMSLMMVVRAPVMAVWAMTRIVGQGFEWTLATAIAVVFLLIMIITLIILIMPKFKIMQTLLDNITRVTRENLAGLRVVRAYNAESYQENKFDKANIELTSTQLFTTKAMALFGPLIGIIMSGISLAIFWIGAYLVDAAGLSLIDGVPERLSIFAGMIVFSQYAMMVIMSFIMLTIVFAMLPRAVVSARRINEVLDTVPVITDGELAAGLSGMAGDIEFENVSFKYPEAEEYVLEDISFSVKSGQTVAIIGSTGSGKSTVASLIPRFFDATKGRVLVSGVDVREYRLETLYSMIGYVSQKAYMFKGTVSSNIGFGDNIGENATDGETEKEIKWAAGVAQASEFVEEMDGGYEADISQGGANISGGQKQRLSIARAVCRRPQLYIFDDSFSALDYKTDRVLRNELKRETKGTTCLIVAQRIGTIIDADYIIVLDEGKIVGKGTHRELLSDCVVYREIALSQLSESEVGLS